MDSGWVIRNIALVSYNIVGVLIKEISLLFWVLEKGKTFTKWILIGKAEDVWDKSDNDTVGETIITKKLLGLVSLMFSAGR